MAATNKSPWRKNVLGETSPLRQQLLVALGSTRTIKRGEICYFDAASGDLIPVAGAADNLHALVVADEEQSAAMPARFMWFILPRPGDVFEFALDAATQILWGDELQINDSQTLKKSTTDPIAQAIEVLAPDTGVTWPTISRVLCVFYQAGKLNAGLKFPLIGGGIGDAS